MCHGQEKEEGLLQVNDLECRQGLYSHTLDVGRDIRSFVLLTSPSAEAIEFLCGLGREITRLELLLETEQKSHDSVLRAYEHEINGLRSGETERVNKLQYDVARLGEEVRNRESRIEAAEQRCHNLQCANDELRIRVKGRRRNEELERDLEALERVKLSLADQITKQAQTINTLFVQRDAEQAKRLRAEDRLIQIRGFLDSMKSNKRRIREVLEEK